MNRTSLRSFVNGPKCCEAIPGWDCGDEAAAWFTQYLKEGHRLLYNPGIQLRPIDAKTHLYVNSAKNDDKLVFQDDGPFLLITQSSFDDLSRRLVERDVTGHVTLEHFRPTITISGQSPPFDEDHWNEVYIGDVKFTVLMPCGRCMFTTIDPLKGTVRPDGEPLKTLRSLVNKTLNDGRPPLSWKNALVTPIPKISSFSDDSAERRLAVFRHAAVL